MIQVPQTLPEELEVQIARTQEDLSAAFALLHDRYLSEGFMKPHLSGMRVTKYHALPSTTTIVAKWKGEVVGTCSIIRSSGFGVPLESIFDISAFKNKGMRIGEVSSLAIHPKFSGKHGLVLFSLCKYLVHYSINYFGLDGAVIAVNPSWIDFYRSIFLFDNLALKEAPEYSFVNGAPAVGAYLNLHSFYEELLKNYGHLDDKSNLHRFMAKMQFDNLKYPTREAFKISEPIWTPTSLDHFFNKRTEVFKDLSPIEIHQLHLLYNTQEFRNVLPPLPDKKVLRYIRSEKRFDIETPARVFVSPVEHIALTVHNVSETGLFGISNARGLRSNQHYQLKVALGPFEHAELTASLVWENSSGGMALKIHSSCKNWKSFIQQLDTELISHPIIAAAELSAEG